MLNHQGLVARELIPPPRAGDRPCPADGADLADNRVDEDRAAPGAATGVHVALVVADQMA
jgi:hypothetical protein